MMKSTVLNANYWMCNQRGSLLKQMPKGHVVIFMINFETSSVKLGLQMVWLEKYEK